MKTISKLFPLLALVALLTACKDHDLGNSNVITQNDIALSAAQEPGQVNSAATGTASVTYDKGTKKLTYIITYSNLSGNATMGHIHGSSPRGVNSGVLFPFANIPAATSGAVTGTATLSAAQEEDLLNGLFYFNFHTVANPGGEIRGQIEFYNQSFNVSKKGIALSGDQEVPAKPGAGTGSADVTYNKNTKRLSYYIMYSNLTGNPAAGHIHGSAARGANAAVLFPFASLPASTSGAVNGSVVLTAAQETDLLNGLYYFNFHTAANPGGEIRGQIEF